MNVTSVNNTKISSRGKLKIPKNSYLKNKKKVNNIDAVKMAGVFDKFEQNMSSIIRTFVYMIKN